MSRWMQRTNCYCLKVFAVSFTLSFLAVNDAQPYTTHDAPSVTVPCVRVKLLQTTLQSTTACVQVKSYQRITHY